MYIVHFSSARQKNTDWVLVERDKSYFSFKFVSFLGPFSDLPLKMVTCMCHLPPTGTSIYIFIHIYIHVHLYIHVYLCVCDCVTCRGRDSECLRSSHFPSKPPSPSILIYKILFISVFYFYFFRFILFKCFIFLSSLFLFLFPFKPPSPSILIWKILFYRLDKYKTWLTSSFIPSSWPALSQVKPGTLK